MTARRCCSLVLFCGGGDLLKGIRPILLQVLFILISISSYSQVSSDIYQRTFLLKTTVGTGTTFAVDIDNRQYLVTARHMVAGLGDHHEVSLLLEKRWKSFDVKILRCQDPIDIAVLVPNQVLTHAPALPLALSPGKLYFGQELFFVGFPFGWSMQFSTLSPNPIAIVKRGILSANIEQDGARLMLIDGYNNFGFSGGPIVYHEVGKSGYDLSVTGVVSGFQPELRPVVKKVRLRPGESVVGIESWRLITDEGGNPVKLVDTGNSVPVNTGFLSAFGIEYAIDLIHEHPIGLKIDP